MAERPSLLSQVRVPAVSLLSPLPLGITCAIVPTANMRFVAALLGGLMALPALISAAATASPSNFAGSNLYYAAGLSSSERATLFKCVPVFLRGPRIGA